MKKHIVIIGAGVAGLSAAYAARERAASLTIVSTGVGASALGGGAVDDLPWEAWYAAARTLGELPKLRSVPEDVRAFAEALGLWDVPTIDTPAPIVATAAGRLRPARGRDRGLLDLGSLRQTTVLVPRLPRANWDADALAATLESEWLARETNLRFLPVDSAVMRFTDEARIADADLAMRHDEPARLAWLAERLRETLDNARRSTPASAVLLGSWLGVDRERATELSSKVGVPVGEALVGVGSSAGLRFEAAAKRLMERLSVKFVEKHVPQVRRQGDKIEVVLSGKEVLSADALVIATGGLAAGGIVYAPPDLLAGEHMPSKIEPAFAFGIPTTNLPIVLRVGHDHVDAGSSVFGPALDTTAWPINARASTLESVGIGTNNGRVCPGVMAAGDVVAGKRRTVLEAVASGLRAGHMV